MLQKKKPEVKKYEDPKERALGATLKKSDDGNDNAKTNHESMMERLNKRAQKLF